MDRNEFLSAARSAQLQEGQVPLWFWNDKLEREELKRQLALMTEKGVEANAPHARSGYEGSYLDEDWMDAMRTAIDYKAAHGEKLWLYDEFNWPSGVAGGLVTRDEKLREKYLTIERFTVPAGERFRRQPVRLVTGDFDVTFITRGAEGKAVIDNLFLYDAETMAQLPVTDFQPDDLSGSQFNLSANDFELLRDRDTVVYEVKLHIEPFDGEGWFDPDYLNPLMTEKFIDVTYEAYFREFPEAFGRVITASFNDETRFCHALPWTEELPKRFFERYGYAIQEKLPMLVMEGEEAGRVRCDYFGLIADLYRENYHKKLNDWCAAHGIAYAPHLLAEECMAGHARFSGDLLRQFKETGIPGADHLGKGIGSLDIRFVCSAAEVYGKDRVFCETFGGAGWDLTFDEYIRQVSWLYSQGVTTICNHGFFYSTRDFRNNDWPPSQFFQWDGFARMREGNDMCRRNYGILKDSRRMTDLLVYHPIESFWLNYIPDQGFTHGYHMGPFIRNERAMALDRAEQVVLNRLQEANCDFTVFPADAADLFEVRSGKLLSRLTGVSYSTFLLMNAEVVPLPAARLLCEFARSGGKLVIAETLSSAATDAAAFPRLGLRPEEDEEVRRIFSGLQDCENVVWLSGKDADETAAYVSALKEKPFTVLEGTDRCQKTLLSYPDWLIDPYIHTGEDIKGVSWCAYRNEAEQRTYYYFVNYQASEETLLLDMHTEAATRELWDPLRGEIRALPVTDGKLTLALPAGYGVFLVEE